MDPTIAAGALIGGGLLLGGGAIGTLLRDHPPRALVLESTFTSVPDVAAGTYRDQPVLKDLLWESDLRFYVLPPEFNLRRVTLLDAWEPLDARPTILHSHRFMDHMRHGGDRISDVVALMDAERAALEAEWDAAGGRDDHPVRRFDPKGD